MRVYKILINPIYKQMNCLKKNRTSVQLLQNLLLINCLKKRIEPVTVTKFIIILFIVPCFTIQLIDLC